ncbi:MAG: hypothetical protein M3R08_06260 [Bacteroidota bacterium]|nr:hypothetical protein [Bacteroidota bacterium]
MKNSGFIKGFISAFVVLVLVGADIDSNSDNEVPRYHVTMHEGGGVAYDAITGQTKRVGHADVKNGSIKEILDRSED